MRKREYAIEAYLSEFYEILGSSEDAGEFASTQGKSEKEIGIEIYENLINDPFLADTDSRNRLFTIGAIQGLLLSKLSE